MYLSPMTCGPLMAYTGDELGTLGGLAVCLERCKYCYFLKNRIETVIQNQRLLILTLYINYYIFIFIVLKRKYNININFFLTFNSLNNFF